MLFAHGPLGSFLRNNIFPVRKIAMVLISVAVLFSAGCAKRPPVSDPQALSAYLEANDPLEPMNRAIFSFNQGFDDIILEPAARFYRQFGPPDIRKGISNFVNNWREPVTFVNDVLQGEAKRATTSLTRFLINSTFGLLGCWTRRPIGVLRAIARISAKLLPSGDLVKAPIS